MKARQGRRGDLIKDARTRDAIMGIEQQLIEAFAGIGNLSAGRTANGGGILPLPPGITDHGALTGLSDDDHAQYLHLPGRAGGQTLVAIDDNSPFNIDGSVGHTASLTRWRNSALTTLARISSSGAFITLSGSISSTLSPGTLALTGALTSLSFDGTSGDIISTNSVGNSLITLHAAIVTQGSGGSNATTALSALGGLVITSGFSAGTHGVPLRIKHNNSGSPTEDLTQWRDQSNTTTLASVSSAGNITTPHITAPLATLGIPGGSGEDTVIGVALTGSLSGLFLDDGSGFKMNLGVAPLTADRSVGFPDGSGTLLIGGVLGQVTGSVASAFKTDTISSGARFEDTGNSLRRLRFILSGASANNHAIALSNTAARTYTLPDVTGTVPIATAQPASGSLLRGAGATTAMAEVAIGSTGDVLTVSGGQPTWAAIPQAWPVGSVFTAVVSTNPNTLLGYGTWTQIAAGRVLVGIDSGDTDFDTVRETRGAKTVASAGTISPIAAENEAAVDAAPVGLDVAPAGHTHPAPTFTGTATSVVQPSYVVYFWERTA